MSSIVKAEYVMLESKKKAAQTVINIPDPKEELFTIYNQRDFIIKEARDEALRIVSRAKRNAQAEIAECKRRGYEEGYSSGMESGKNRGYEDGFRQGQEEGSRSTAMDLERINDIKLKEINKMIQIIEDEKENIIAKYEKEIEKLPLDIAEKIMRQQIELKDDALARIIESVVRDFKNEEWVKIYISDKDDAEKIKADKGLVEELKKISNDIKFEVSKELKETSCIVETHESFIDAGIDTQLCNLREILFK